MSELVDWLKAQLDEDERIAQAASEWPWTLHPEGDKILRHNDGTYDDWEDEDLIVVETMGWSSQATRSNGLHVIRWEPSQVVQDIAAKRLIIAQLDRAHDNPFYDAAIGAIRLLAWGCRHREGWKVEWFPDELWPHAVPNVWAEPRPEMVHRYELQRRSDGKRVDSELVPADWEFTYRPPPWQFPGYPDAYIWRVYNTDAPMQPLVGELEPVGHPERLPDESDASWVDRVLAQVVTS